jgi:hypothetical protein
MNRQQTGKGWCLMPDAVPRRTINIQEVTTRNAAARRIVAGFSATTPTLSEVWWHLGSALADVGDLADEVTRLQAELAATRLDRANLLAAMRATLAAQRDGEADPLSYLRDQLQTPQNASQTREGGNRD